jgi:outer membrane protein assembly factor BamA
MKASILALAAALTPLLCAAQQPAETALVVEELRCRGNEDASCDFILGHVYLGPGDALDETELENAELRLATLRIFESVHFYLEKGSARGKAIVVVEVAEAEPIVTETLLGASDRLDAFRAVFAGRLTHQNLFGTGKTADASLVAVYPFNEPSEEDYAASVRYADPHLFGSKRYFAIASASYVDARGETDFGAFDRAEVFRVGVTLGRRLWDFSYVTVGYGFRPRLHQVSGRWQRSGVFEVDEEKNRHVMDFIYGWSSEDDLYFPTRGSSFHIGGGFDFRSGEDGYDEFHLQFRKTWRTARGLLTFKVGGDPSPEYRQSFNESQLVSLSYSRPLDHLNGVRRGRWYIEPGYSEPGFRPEGQAIREVGLKVGVRLETDAFGLLDLYLMGSEDVGQ